MHFCSSYTHYTPSAFRAPPSEQSPICGCTSDALTFWHRSFTFNSNKSPTWCNNFSVYYPDVFTAQHVSGVFPPIIRTSMTAVAASGFTFASWWQSCCVRGQADRSARPRTQHDYHHDTKVKPEAASAVIELPMMGGKMPETCWARNKRQNNKLKNYYIRLVIYLNCTMMQGLTNLKFYI
jgi:hypothetical protein